MKDRANSVSASVCDRVVGREVISLDGLWEIADSVLPDEPPQEYRHRVPVPGLVHSAVPEFENVDLFESNSYTRWYAPAGAITEIYKILAMPERRLPAYSRKTPAGISYQERDYFWYRTTFKAPVCRSVAILKVNKAQFGLRAWVNGQSAGDTHLSCVTSASYDISATIRWSQDNEVLIRVGAHPGVLPNATGQGVDFENVNWAPGVWDSVSVALCDNPRIETIQVAPRVGDSQVVVQTQLRNCGTRTERFDLRHTVHEWGASTTLGEQAQSIVLAPGEEKTVVDMIGLPDAKLWTPQCPHLYVLKTSTGGDSTSTRFGMREFRFDTPTRRAYLNGKPYFLRGGTVALNRFFDDPKSAQLPWTEDWVRKLLVSIPKRMHWNSLRSFCGALPEKWLDIADEAGLLIQYEYPMTYEVEKPLEPQQYIAEYSAWMRDAWNHPSIAIWDACNESLFSILPEKVVPAIRGLDLSNRPWDCGYNAPCGFDDPVEDHPYKFMLNVLTEAGSCRYGPEFDMTDLEHGSGAERLRLTPPTGHAMIINEYDWLWLNRDGSPTLLTQELYRKLPYPVQTAEQRLETNAYLLAGLTEYWRAHRHYAGLIHYAYLLSSHPRAATSDHFADIETLQLNSYFESYVAEAFKPLGVYINFWRRTLSPGDKRRIQVMMVNDEDEIRQGILEWVVEDKNGRRLSQQATAYTIPALGQHTLVMSLEAPSTAGKFLLMASATSSHTPHSPTVSRRHFEVAEP